MERICFLQRPVQSTVLPGFLYSVDPPSTGNEVAPPPQLGMRLLPPLNWERGCPPSTGNEVAPPSTGNEVAPPLYWEWCCSPPQLGTRLLPPLNWEWGCSPPQLGMMLLPPPSTGNEVAPPSTGNEVAPPLHLKPSYLESLTQTETHFHWLLCLLVLLLATSNVCYLEQFLVSPMCLRWRACTSHGKLPASTIREIKRKTDWCHCTVFPCSLNDLQTHIAFNSVPV